jgi:hypothetical protein
MHRMGYAPDPVEKKPSKNAAFSLQNVSVSLLSLSFCLWVDGYGPKLGN